MENDVTETILPLAPLRDQSSRAASHTKSVNDLASLTAKGELSLVDLVRLYSETRRAYEEIDEQRKSLYELTNYMSTKLLPERFEAEGVKTINVENVGRVTVSYRKSASLSDKMAGMAWFEEHHPDIITSTINSQTLASFINSEYIEKNLEPPDFVKFNLSPVMSITQK